MTLRVNAITKTYTSKKETRQALADTSLEVHPNEFVSVVGPSGCGKSTLLMMMAGLLPPSGGEVVFEDTRVDSPPVGLSVVFQDYSRSLFPWLSVRRNLSLALSSEKLDKAEVDERVANALRSVGLPDAGHLYPWQMSGGMQQRVAIARAVALTPRVMLMDEPFAAVDAQTRADLEDLVLRVRDEYKVTCVFVTHDIDEAIYLGDRIVVMAASPGRVIEDLRVDLPRPRHQVETKRDPRFAEMRTRVYELVMRPDSAVRQANGAAT